MTLVKPSNFGLSFPSFRPGQEKAIRKIVNSKKRVFFYQAPVGSGKSGTAIAVARALGADTAVLTTDLGLQNQYRDDYDLVEMRGRRHFTCTLVPTKTADKGPCIGGERCSYKRGGCPYYDQRHHALRQPIYVTNYAMQVALTGLDQEGAPRRHLIVADEAHKLEQVLVGQGTLELRHSVLKRMGIDAPNSNILGWAKSKIDHATWVTKTASDGDKADFGKALAGIQFLAGSQDLEGYVVVPGTDLTEVRPLVIANMFRDLFLRNADQVLLMSGTLLDGQYQANLLGLEDDEWEWLEEPMRFPKGRRPIHIVGDNKVSAQRPDSYLETIRLADRHIERHMDEKGLIHTANYSLAKKLKETSKFKQHIIFYDSMNRQQAIEQFRKAKAPAYLAGPSLMEGLDLPYRQVTQQLLLKLPIPNLQDPWVDARRSLDSKWDGFQTASAVVQAYGRGMRSADDWGEFWILDANIKCTCNGTSSTTHRGSEAPSYGTDARLNGLGGKT